MVSEGYEQEDAVNRRDFFKAFAAIGVTAALAETALVRAVTEPEPLLLTQPALFGGTEPWALLRVLTARSTEIESRAACLSLLRTPSTPIWIEQFNTLTGVMIAFAPGEEIAVTREHNMRLAGDFDGVALAQFHVPGRGPVLLHYAMLREREPRLRQEILMRLT